MGVKKKKRRKKLGERLKEMDLEKLDKIKKEIKEKEEKGYEMKKYLDSLAKTDAVQDFIDIQKLRENRGKKLEEGESIGEIESDIKSKKREFQKDMNKLSKEQRKNLQEIEENYPERVKELMERSEKYRKEGESDLGKSMDKAIRGMKKNKKKEEDKVRKYNR